jgi:hypothetical protein
MNKKALRDSWTAYAEEHGLIREVGDADRGGKASPSPISTRNKYGAVRTVVDGITFASKKEAAHYEQLKLRQMAGEITELVLQPKYHLHVMEIWRSGPIQIRTIGTFTADFEYLELKAPRGEIVTVDVKSEITRKGEAYRLRKKLAEAIHGIHVHEA